MTTDLTTGVYKGPHNFEHKSHLGYDPATGTFDTKNIPPEWKKMFAHVGIKPSHLHSPDTAAKIFSIMEGVDLNAAADPSKSQPPAPPKKAGGPPPPPAPVGGGAPPPPPMTGGPPPPKATGGPPPPPGGAPAPKATGGPPPPMGGPPPPGGGPPKLSGPPPPAGGAPPPAGGAPPPAPKATSSSGSFGGLDLAAQLAAGRAGLHSADARPVADKPPPAAAAAPTLEDALRDAMAGFRPAIEGKDEWSDEEWSD